MIPDAPTYTPSLLRTVVEFAWFVAAVVVLVCAVTL